MMLMVFLVVLPLALLFDYWPDRERLDYRGSPASREWQRQITHPAPDDEHH
jgi:hypothetical protein